MNQIKIYDVAGKAGVSLATVSRVLNHPEKVKPFTRARIERIINDLGYKPNLNAKGLASQKSTTIGVISPRLDRARISSILSGVADCAAKRGYSIRLFVNDIDKKDRTPLEIEKETWANVNASSVDGVIYINDEIDEDCVDIIKSANMPVVLANIGISDGTIPAVTVDYIKLTRELTKSFIKKGYKNIWFINSSHRYTVNAQKVIGYSKVMLENGLKVQVFSVSGVTENNEDQFREILKNNEKPEAVIAVRDSYGVSFLNICKEFGYKCPDDIEIIGFNNTRYAVLSRPRLSSVGMDVFELGDIAMNLLTELMEDPTKVNDKIKYVGYEIIKRESTK